MTDQEDWKVVTLDDNLDRLAVHRVPADPVPQGSAAAPVHGRDDVKRIANTMHQNDRRAHYLLQTGQERTLTRHEQQGWIPGLVANNGNSGALLVVRLDGVRIALPRAAGDIVPCAIRDDFLKDLVTRQSPPKISGRIGLVAANHARMRIDNGSDDGRPGAGAANHQDKLLRRD